VGIVPAPARCAAEHYEHGRDASLQPLHGGLINQTWLLDGPLGLAVLQRVNPIFRPEVHEDIAAVTLHLEAVGMRTPTLIRTRSGKLFVDQADDGIWRLLSHISGVTHARTEDPWLAREAATLLGRFHQALSDLDHSFRFSRAGVHETAVHLQRLHDVLGASAGHPAYEEVAPLGERILAARETLPALDDCPQRILHGDPKLDNIRFDEQRRAICLLDLDTLRRGPLAHDLGDAWRSWCNRSGEDEPQAVLDLELLRGAVGGYATSAGELLDEREALSLPVGLERIALELAARFCTDALEDRYFGWNEQRFGSRREHNLVRASGQYTLATAVGNRREEIQEIVAEAFRG